MNKFNELVFKQMKTMDELLNTQSELERYEQIERKLHNLHNETALKTVRERIVCMKSRLTEIQHIFEKQTNELIQSYKEKSHS